MRAGCRRAGGLGCGRSQRRGFSFVFDTNVKPRVVILGGGFGGLYAAQSLKGAPVEVTVVDRRNFHLFQPLLYQVATGALSPANIAAPLRFVLRRHYLARLPRIAGG